jgi:hypothetical protein
MMQRLRIFLSLGCWIGFAGCGWASWPPGSLLHPVHPLRPEVLARVQCVPAWARDHVYVFLVNGVDPGNLCNVRGLYDYVCNLGFSHVYFGQLWDAPHFVHKIRQIRCQDPQAKVFLLGYSAGAEAVCLMAQSLKRDGTPIDVLVYLSGDMLCNCKFARPENACKIVNIRAWGVVFLAGGLINGADLTGCENYYLGVVRHACVPRKRRMLELLADELAVLAAGVPACPVLWP